MRVRVYIRVGKKIYSSNSNEAIKKKKMVVKQKVEAKGFCIKKKSSSRGGNIFLARVE